MPICAKLVGRIHFSDHTIAKLKNVVNSICPQFVLRKLYWQWDEQIYLLDVKLTPPYYGKIRFQVI